MPSSAIIVQPFDQSWTLADSQRYQKVGRTRPDYQSQSEAYHSWRKGPFAQVNEDLEAAIAGHLAYLAQEGKLFVPENSDAVELNWLDNWRALIAKPTNKSAYRDLAREFSAAALNGIRMASAKGITDQQFHDNLVAKLTNGEFDQFDLEVGACFNTDVRLSLTMDQWKPTLGTLAPFKMGQPPEFRPLTPGQIAPQGVEHVVLQVPSGQLLINDWFRIKAFTQLARDTASQHEVGSLNAAVGRVRQTEVYARELGFVSVSVNDGNPKVVLEAGRLLVGEAVGKRVVPSEASPASQDLGTVCTDLWQASIIDRQVLVELVARSTGLEEAEKQVAAMEDQTGTLIKVQVPPGEYHLYFSSDPQVFAANFASPDVSMKKISEPMFVFSPDELTLSAKPNKKARRSPR